VSAPEALPGESGRAIGRYRIDARLDRDSMDDVYKGFDPLIERPVVIKVFQLGLKDEAAEASVKEIFYREMQRTGALVHEGIATLFDAGELPGALFMASEFVDGVALPGKLSSELALDVPMRASIVAQIADALDYARDLGTWHLRLRPTSILVCGDLSLKISGFGVAPVLEALAASSSGSTSASIAPSRYDAPERRTGAGDARADVFSLAQIALDIFLPQGTAPSITSDGVAVAVPPYLAEHGVDVQGWTETFMRALAADPAKRFECAGDFKRELLLALNVGEDEARLAWVLSSAGQVPASEAETSVTQAAADAVAAMFADTQPLQPYETTRIADAGRAGETLAETMMAGTPPTTAPSGSGAEAVTLAHGDLETLLAEKPHGGRK
jgi:serine/threonine-protein kinase